MDEALAKEVLALLGEKGVLVSVESDAVVALRCGVAAQGDSLGAHAVSVLDVEVVELSVGGVVGDCGWDILAFFVLVKGGYEISYPSHRC